MKLKNWRNYAKNMHKIQLTQNTNFIKLM